MDSQYRPILLFFSIVLLITGGRIYADERPIIKIGSFSDKAPYSITNSKGENIGIEQDIISLINQKANFTLQLETQSWIDLINNWNNKTLSALLFSNTQNSRTDEITYSKEIFSQPMAAFSLKKTDSQLENLSKIVIGIPKDSQLLRAYLDTLGKSFTTFKDTSEGIHLLTKGKIDIMFSDLYSTVYLAKSKFNLNLTIQNILEDYKTSYTLGVLEGNDALLKKINNAIDKITPKEKEALRSKWINSQTFIGNINLTISESNWIKHNPQVSYWGYEDYPPIISKRRDQYKGIIPDFLEQLGGKIGIEFIPSKENSSRAIFPGMTLENSSLQNYLFTEPYLRIPTIIISNKKGPLYFTNFKNLEGKKIALARNLSITDYLINTYPDFKFQIFNSPEEGLKSLVLSQADYYVGDMISTSYTLNHLGYTQLMVIGEINHDLELRMAIPPNMAPLVPIINKGLSQINSAEKSAIMQKWTTKGVQTNINYLLLGQILVVFLIIFLIILIWNQKLKLEIKERQKSENALKISEKKARLAEEKSMIAKENAEELALVAQEANKAKGQFLANMTHEIRTPLNSIVGFTELLEKTALKTQQKSYLSSVKTAADVLLMLINDVLDFSKIEAGKMELKPMGLQISDLYDDLRVIFSQKAQNKKINIRFCFEGHEKLIFYGDKLRLEQILINLISNAIKFTDEGDITILTQFTNLNTKTKEMCLTFEVKDTGIGIPEDQQDSIFNLFVQSNTLNTYKYGGTGLGLGICQKIVSLMNGRIELKSKIDKGSCFKVIIPHIKFDLSSVEKTGDASIVHSQFIIPKNVKDLFKEPLPKEALTLWENVKNSGDPFEYEKFTENILSRKEISRYPNVKKILEKMQVAARDFNLEELVNLTQTLNLYIPKEE